MEGEVRQAPLFSTSAVILASVLIGISTGFTMAQDKTPTARADRKSVV